MIEIFITCWFILTADGRTLCYCEGETPPTEVVLVVDEVKRPKPESAPIP